MATYETQVENLIGEDINASLTDVLQIDVTNWMAEGLQIIVNILPEDMLWMLEANTIEYNETTAIHGVSVGTNKILYVQRFSDTNADGALDMLVECREVSASLRGRVKSGSGWKEEASGTDPVWYKLGRRIYIEPSPTDYFSDGSQFSAVVDVSKASGSTSFTTSGTYTGTGALGYFIEVIAASGGFDRFRWSTDESTWNESVIMNINSGLNNLSYGVNIVWADSNANHTVGDKYEFSAEPSKRSKVYFIENPPSGWKYDSDYLTGAVPKEIDPIVLNYVAARAAEQKLASIQNGSSASLEQYIIDEDIDLAQAQQVLIQDTHALIDRYQKEYQMGIQGLMSGTYAPQSTAREEQQPVYSNVAQ